MDEAVFDKIRQGYRVFVGDIGANFGKYDIEREFKDFGPITDTWVARNPPGFAFLVFKYAEDAERAVKKLHGRRLSGRRIRVEHARPFQERRRLQMEARRGENARSRRSRSRSRGRRSRSRDRKRSRSRSKDRRTSESHSHSKKSKKSRRSRSRSRSDSRSRPEKRKSSRSSRTRSKSPPKATGDKGKARSRSLSHRSPETNGNISHEKSKSPVTSGSRERDERVEDSD